jgi:hypothetical protein
MASFFMNNTPFYTEFIDAMLLLSEFIWKGGRLIFYSSFKLKKCFIYAILYLYYSQYLSAPGWWRITAFTGVCVCVLYQVGVCSLRPELSSYHLIKGFQTLSLTPSSASDTETECWTIMQRIVFPYKYTTSLIF